MCGEFDNSQVEKVLQSKPLMNRMDQDSSQQWTLETAGGQPYGHQNFLHYTTSREFDNIQDEKALLTVAEHQMADGQR